jgi:hypothetical protein
MNLITHNTAYSIFPRSTFVEERSIKFARSPFTSLRIPFEFENHGWIESRTHDSASLRAEFEQGFRHLRDKKCWRVPLAPNNGRCIDIIESNTWSLRYDGNHRPTHSWISLEVPDRFHFSYIMDTELSTTIRNVLSSNLWSVANNQPQANFISFTRSILMNVRSESDDLFFSMMSRLIAQDYVSVANRVNHVITQYIHSQ